MSATRDHRPVMPVRRWRVGSREIAVDRPLVAGILNITPDSFSDGGNFFALDRALRHAASMIAEGADILDIGGESTRPGASQVSVADECARVIPVIDSIRKTWPRIFISADTTKSEIARAALDAGADIINDVSAMRLDPAMPSIVARSGCGVIIMHSRGMVHDMAGFDHARYADVVKEVLAEIGSQMLLAEEAGVDRSNIVVDPGFGFAKTSEHSNAILRDLDRFSSLDVPIMVGVSRKRFVTDRVTAEGESATMDRRDAATAVVNVLALERGAMLFRVHNVSVNRIALDTAWATAGNS